MTDLPPHTPYLTDEGPFSKREEYSIKAADNPGMFDNFIKARWFSRGWCLQELIAPKRLLFYNLRPNGSKCQVIGDKAGLVKTISAATNIDAVILEHKAPLSTMSVAQRMSWASNRKTRRVEDQAYSLLGIFDVNMPMLYGEGKRAFIRF